MQTGTYRSHRHGAGEGTAEIVVLLCGRLDIWYDEVHPPHVLLGCHRSERCRKVCFRIGRWCCGKLVKLESSESSAKIHVSRARRLLQSPMIIHFYFFVRSHTRSHTRSPASATVGGAPIMQSPTYSLSAAMLAIPKPRTCTNVRCRPLRCKLQLRGFTSTATTQAMVQSGRMPKDIASRLPSQPSMKTLLKNQNKSENVNDLGFLPQTFVYGPGSVSYPSYIREPRNRLRIEFLRIKQAGIGLFTFVAPMRERRVIANSCSGTFTCVNGVYRDIP